MEFKVLNKVATLKNRLPTKKLIELEVKTNHPVHNIRLVKTEYGKRYIAEIGGQFKIYLPERLTEAFEENEDEFKKLLEAARARELYMETFADKWSKIKFKHIEKSSE